MSKPLNPSPEKAFPHVVTALIAKRAELAGKIEHLQSEVISATVELDHIDASLRIFAPDIDISEIGARPVPPAHHAFRGEVSRIIIRNRYGVTRYDEPRERTTEFLNAWGRINCQATSPVHQRELIEEQNSEETYKLTHKLNADCVLADLHNAAEGYKDRRFSDPHYCRNGQYERDQAAKTQSATTDDVPAVDK